MKVTPLDIRRKEFRRSVRGYLDEDVDVFLDTVADEVERVSKVNTELEEKVRGLEEQVSGHTHIREALEKTLVAAQLQSEEIRSKAQKESQSILHEAEAKAKAVVDDFYAQTQAVQQTLMQLKLLEEDFRFKFKALLEGYLKLVEEGPIVLSVAPAEREESEPQKARVSRVAAKPAPAQRPPEMDDSPTSETSEVASLVADQAVTAGRVRPAPLPPHLPKSAATAKTAGPPVGDLTAETAKPVTPGRGGKHDRPAGGPDDEGQGGAGGVYFGRAEKDPDDPFPEMEGDPSKPRDFEW